MKKVLIIGAGAMGTAFSFPLLDNNHKVTLTEPYNTKLINQLLKKRKFHPSLKIILPKKLLIKKFSSSGSTGLGGSKIDKIVETFNGSWDLLPTDENDPDFQVRFKFEFPSFIE